MDAADLVFAGIARQAELVRAGEVSARELVEACLERIARLDPDLGAFRVVLGERALAEAAQADARRAAGDERPLLGVPIAVKDVADVAGEPTTHGTGAHGPPAERDAELVRRLRSAGAIVVGKTRTPELALWPFTESATFGVTRNPWRLDRTPGGSSGGAAAAVTAGMVGAAHGTDGAGSIRIPAACCGLFGLKPQRNRLPLAPDEDHWYGLTAAGVLTRSVLDTALFFDAVLAGGHGAGPATSPFPGAESLARAARDMPGRLRIALALNPPPGSLRPYAAGRRALEETAEVLRGVGHLVRECEVDYGTVPLAVAGRYLRGAHDEGARLPYPRRLERRTRALVRLGGRVPPALLARERATEGARARRLGALLDDHDLLLVPVLARPPVEIGRYEGLGALRTLSGVGRGFGGPFTSPWNLTGQPAAAVPAGFDGDGLPVSVQLVARPNDESTLLSLAAQLERERPWADRRPPHS